MAKFRFRLATVQKLREAHRDEMRSKLAEAYQAQQLLDTQIGQVQAEADNLQAAHRIKLQSSSVDMNQLLDTQRYQAVLRAQITTMSAQSQLLAAEVEKRRHAVVQADQDVRVLEKLHERQLKSHQQDALREEAKVMDEIASQTPEARI